MSESTKNIYAFNLLKSSTLDVNIRNGYLVSRLIDIESKQGTGQVELGEFARQVLSTYRLAESHFEVSRVCLAYNIPFSRKLQILSSCSAEDNTLTDLVPGYSCYVSTTSSLFAAASVKHSHGKIRTYSDVSKIIDSFRQGGRPIQRTIGKLAAAGLKSGMCLPIENGLLGNGVLFLNSHVAGAFDNFEDTDYLSTCILRLVASASLQRHAIANMPIDTPLASLLDSLPFNNVFCSSQFLYAVRKALRDRKAITSKAELQNSVPFPFFLPSRTVIYLFLKALDLGLHQPLSDDFKIHITHQDDDPMRITIHFDCGVDSWCRGEGSVPEIESITLGTGITFVPVPGGFQLKTTVESANAREVRYDYSVYQEDGDN